MLSPTWYLFIGIVTFFVSIYIVYRLIKLLFRVSK